MPRPKSYGIALGWPLAPGGRAPQNSLDFTAGAPPAMSYVRTGGATAFTNAGGVVSFADNYAPITDRGLLIEEARTNLTPQSWNTADAGWAVAAGNILTPGQPDPMGGTGAALITADGTLSSHSVFPPNMSINNATSYDFSFFVKPGSLTRFQLNFNATRFPTLPYVDFLLSGAGSISVISGAVAARIDRYGAWYRLSGIVTSSGTGTSRASIRPLIVGDEAAGATTTAQGDFSITGADVQAATFSGSPIVTGASAVTRGLPVASVIVPPARTSWRATYGPANTVTTGSGLTPGASFDLVSGRPWTGLGNELRTLEFLA